MSLHHGAASGDDRPRERLWSVGAVALTTAELVAILLGTGSREHGVLETAGRLLQLGDGSLRRLAARPAPELQRATGVGPTKAARLVAAFDLGARLAGGRPPQLTANPHR